MKKYIFLVLPLLCFMTLFCVAILQMGKVSAQKEVLADTQLSGLHYTIRTIEDKSVDINVDYDIATSAGLLRFKDEAMRLSAVYAEQQPSQSFTVDVALNQPLSFAQTALLAQKYKLTLTDIAVRTVTADGQRGAISSAIAADQDFATPVNRILQNVQSYGTSVQLQGVVSFHAQITGREYKALTTDAAVFLADALQPYLTDKAQQLSSAHSSNLVQYHKLGIYWYLENLHMLKN